MADISVDTARLDWLDDRMHLHDLCHLDVFQNETVPDDYVLSDRDYGELGIGTSLRAAIDDAMQRESAAAAGRTEETEPTGHDA